MHCIVSYLCFNNRQPVLLISCFSGSQIVLTVGYKVVSEMKYGDDDSVLI